MGGCGGFQTAKILAGIYDVFTAIVSLLDVITDLIVLYEFYVMDRMEFFIASLTILIVAQFAYCIAFWFKFKNSFDTYALGGLGFCCMLPFAPILSFAFFFTESSSTPLHQCLHSFYSSFRCELSAFDCCTKSDSNNNAQRRARRQNDDRSPEMEELRQWVKEKLMKHIGFIIEALIEAFPQSILQLIAIVYFNDTNNYISMLSIMLSMISVSTKSFILSVVASYDWRSAVFNWLSCVSDFFGIFFIISFAFYVPPDADAANPFETLKYVWIYSIVISIIPFALIGSIGMNFYWTLRLSRDYWCGFFFFVQLGWIVGLCITVMSMTISCFLLVAVAVTLAGLGNRLSTGRAQEFYLPLVTWIKQAQKSRIRDAEHGDLHISKQHDKVIRICCVNRVILETMKKYTNPGSPPPSGVIARENEHNRAWTYNVYEEKMHEYLVQNGVSATAKMDDYPYCHVTLKALAKHSKKRIDAATANEGVNSCKVKLSSARSGYQKLQKLVYEVLDEFMFGIFAVCLKHVCLPLYLLGRVFNVTFVVFIIGYLSLGHGVHIFTSDIPLFQTVMFCCYLALLCFWMMALYGLWKEKRILSFVLPSTKKLRASDYEHNVKEKRREIEEYYESLICQPFAKRYCIQRFGPDITVVIMQFYGHSKLLHFYDDGEPETKSDADEGDNLLTVCTQ